MSGIGMNLLLGFVLHIYHLALHLSVLSSTNSKCKSTKQQINTWDVYLSVYSDIFFNAIVYTTEKSVKGFFNQMRVGLCGFVHLD